MTLAFTHSDNEQFYSETSVCLQQLFDYAKNTDELQFVMCFDPALPKAFQRYHSTSKEAFNVLAQAIHFMQDTDIAMEQAYRIRLAISFYHHLASASNFYTILYNMLRIFQHDPIDLCNTTLQAHCPPDYPAIYLATHCVAKEDVMLATCLTQLFDYDLVRAYQTGRYEITKTGITLAYTHPSEQQVLGFEDFEERLERSINFFVLLKNLIDQYVEHYQVEKQVYGKLYPDQAADHFRIKFIKEKKLFAVLKNQKEANTIQ